MSQAETTTIADELEAEGVEAGIVVEEPVLQPVEDAADPDGPAIPDEPEAEEEPEAPGESPAMALALTQLFEIQDRLDRAVGDHAEKAEVAKTAKKRVESLQDDLSRAVSRLRDARSEGEPDPERYPLYDRKAEVNAAFPRPDAVPPLPPDTFEEFCRRESREQRLDRLPGIKPATIKVLAEAGLHTVEQWRIKREALEEASAPLTSIKGLTEPRLEQVVEALTGLMEGWLARWAEMHPPEPAEVAEPEAEGPAESEGVAEEGVADAGA